MCRSVAAAVCMINYMLFWLNCGVVIAITDHGKPPCRCDIRPLKYAYENGDTFLSYGNTFQIRKAKYDWQVYLLSDYQSHNHAINL